MDKSTKHDSSHYFQVIIKHLFHFLILGAISVYFFGLGLRLSLTTIIEFFPKLNLPITNFLLKIPKFYILENFVYQKLLFWYEGSKEWLTIIIGMPLVFIGFGVFFTHFFNLTSVALNPQINKLRCSKCKETP